MECNGIRGARRCARPSFPGFRCTPSRLRLRPYVPCRGRLLHCSLPRAESVCMVAACNIYRIRYSEFTCHCRCPRPLSLISAQKMPRLSASDHVAQTLKKAIVDGLLPAGEVLRQDEIAAHFHVSKIPVREALKHLEAKGLVTFLRNRGAVVASLSAAEIDEYMEIRAMLEARAARLSAPLISEQTIEVARQHLDEFGPGHRRRSLGRAELAVPFDALRSGGTTDPARRNPLPLQQGRALCAGAPVRYHRNAQDPARTYRDPRCVCPPGPRRGGRTHSGTRARCGCVTCQLP
jgi:DNA-binding transcriptional regulator YhcF (GntR family)